MAIVNNEIYKYAKENNIKMNDGESYSTIYKRCLESNPSLHTIEEHQQYAKELMQKLYDEYDEDLVALMVFAKKPLIATKAYEGFNEVYLYKYIHEAMGYSAQAFLKINQIREKVDKYILEHEFKKLWSEKIGYYPIFDPENKSSELIHWMRIIKRHSFNPSYIKNIEEDLKLALQKADDKYFHKKDLTNIDTIILLYQMVGVTYGLKDFMFSVFTEYDGYGHIVYSHTKDHPLNDFSWYKELYDEEVI